MNAVTDTTTRTEEASRAKFTAYSDRVFQYQAGARATDIQAHLGARLGQLSALLTAIVGEGFEAFDMLNDAHKCNYLWACSMLADECKELADLAQVAALAERKRNEAGEVLQ